MVRRRIQVVIAVGALAFHVQNANGESGSSLTAQTTHAPDSALFGRVVRLLLEDATSTSTQLVVDARPLRNDPRIVTLSKKMPLAVPEFVSQVAHADVLVQDSVVTTQRKSTLTRMSVAEGDASRYSSCPGVLVPETPERTEQKRRHCPAQSTELAFIAIPRQGGAYWPENFDERGRVGASAQSVRVIVTSASLHGQNQVSYDFVFGLSTGGAWELREKKVLLIVE